MQKATNDSLHWRERTGSFSTRGSKRGVNLLGWEQPEEMTPEQERACLQAVVRQLNAQCAAGVLSKEERKQVGAELFALCTRINEIRPKAKNPGINDFIVDILREELPKKQYDILVGRAVARMKAGHLGGRIDGAN